MPHPAALELASTASGSDIRVDVEADERSARALC